ITAAAGRAAAAAGSRLSLRRYRGEVFSQTTAVTSGNRKLSRAVHWTIGRRRSERIDALAVRGGGYFRRAVHRIDRFGSGGQSVSARTINALWNDERACGD